MRLDISERETLVLHKPDLKAFSNKGVCNMQTHEMQSISFYSHVDFYVQDIVELRAFNAQWWILQLLTQNL